jgi:hypothetical protein
MITPLLWFGVALVVLLVLVALAIPLSVLIWWAGWSQRAEAVPPPPPLPPAAPPTSGPFLVYLSGVGDISGEYQTRFEDDLLAEVAARVPGLVVISDVFAYSVHNIGMSSQARLGWFWAWVNTERLRKGSPLKQVGQLINLRNILHVTVSADQRYGPIYNYGVARMILEGLVRHGYVPGSGVAVTLLGYSGGGQISLATAGYLQATLRVPVQVISLGGLMNSSESLTTIVRLTHFYGTADQAQRLPDLAFPARWSLFQGSAWNQALAAGRIRRICLGPMSHAGRGSYLDATCRLADGRSYRDATADAISAQINWLR